MPFAQRVMQSQEMVALAVESSSYRILNVKMIDKVIQSAINSRSRVQKASKRLSVSNVKPKYANVNGKEFIILFRKAENKKHVFRLYHSFSRIEQEYDENIADKYSSFG